MTKTKKRKKKKQNNNALSFPWYWDGVVQYWAAPPLPLLPNIKMYYYFSLCPLTIVANLRCLIATWPSRFDKFSRSILWHAPAPLPPPAHFCKYCNFPKIEISEIPIMLK